MRGPAPLTTRPPESRSRRFSTSTVRARSMPLAELSYSRALRCSGKNSSQSEEWQRFGPIRQPGGSGCLAGARGLRWNHYRQASGGGCGGRSPKLRDSTLIPAASRTPVRLGPSGCGERGCSAFSPSVQAAHDGALQRGRGRRLRRDHRLDHGNRTAHSSSRLDVRNAEIRNACLADTSCPVHRPHRNAPVPAYRRAGAPKEKAAFPAGDPQRLHRSSSARLSSGMAVDADEAPATTTYASSYFNAEATVQQNTILYHAFRRFDLNSTQLRSRPPTRRLDCGSRSRPP